MIIDVRWIDRKGFYKDETLDVRHPEWVIYRQFVIHPRLSAVAPVDYVNAPPVLMEFRTADLRFEYVERQHRLGQAPIWIYREISDETWQAHDAWSHRVVRISDNTQPIQRTTVTDDVSDEEWETAARAMIAEVGARQRGEAR